MTRIHVVNNDRTYTGSPAVSILNILLREGQSISHLCGGKAQCGTCKITVLEGVRFLSPMTEMEKKRLKVNTVAAVDAPVIRLACQTYSYGDISIKILAPGGNP